MLRRSDAAVALFAGCLDVTGTALFIRAADRKAGAWISGGAVRSLYPALTVLLARIFLKGTIHTLEDCGHCRRIGGGAADRVAVRFPVPTIK